jgi:hypothetical protein
MGISTLVSTGMVNHGEGDAICGYLVLFMKVNLKKGISMDEGDGKRNKLSKMKLLDKTKK